MGAMPGSSSARDSACLAVAPCSHACARPVESSTARAVRATNSSHKSKEVIKRSSNNDSAMGGNRAPRSSVPRCEKIGIQCPELIPERGWSGGRLINAQTICSMSIMCFAREACARDVSRVFAVNCSAVLGTGVPEIIKVEPVVRGDTAVVFEPLRVALQSLCCGADARGSAYCLRVEQFLEMKFITVGAAVQPGHE